MTYDEECKWIVKWSDEGPKRYAKCWYRGQTEDWSLCNLCLLGRVVLSLEQLRDTQYNTNKHIIDVKELLRE